MNANKLINMATRMIMRRLINGGINAGVNAMSKPRAKGEQGPWNGEGKSAPKQQFNAKQARQAMRVTRKMTKF